jgi:Na+/H+ antiporter NhaD/arsenite permease-like protein
MYGALIIFGICYAFIAFEKIDRTVAAILGATAVVFLGIIPGDVALERVDLNVFFLLVGMMTIVEVLSQTGLFEWVAVIIAQKARGNGMLILIGLITATALLSAFLDNVTTVVLIVPITILITQILELPTAPFLILEAVFSNIGGSATLIGDPPNILIGSRANLTFLEFLANLTPVIALLMVLLLIILFVIFRKMMRVKPEARDRMMIARPELAITDPVRLKRGLPVFFLTIVGFCVCHTINVEPGLVALAGAMLTVLVTRTSLRKVFERLEWDTLFFLFGLFILVGALEHQGLFEIMGNALFNVTEGRMMLGMLSVLWLSGLLSAVLGAVPVAVAMIPLVHTMIDAYFAGSGLAPELQHQIGEPLWWALALGSCLGGIGTILGSAANVVVVQIAKKNRYHISFMHFARYGLPIVLLSLLFCSLYLYLRYAGTTHF